MQRCLFDLLPANEAGGYCTFSHHSRNAICEAQAAQYLEFRERAQREQRTKAQLERHIILYRTPQVHALDVAL